MSIPLPELGSCLFDSDFVDGDGDELLLCPVRALRKYFCQREHYYFGISNPFFSMTRERNVCHKTPYRAYVNIYLVYSLSIIVFYGFGFFLFSCSQLS